MESKLVSVIIADDHALFADGIEQILLSLSGFEVLAKVNNGKLLLQVLNRLKPDLILLDINMPYMDGMEAALIIKKQSPEIKVVLLSMYYDTKIITTAKTNHIDGFIVKDITAPELKSAILNVMSGQQVFILPEAIRENVNSKITDSFLDRYKLSVREIEIINLIRKGKSNKEIAYELELSNYTIETHRKNIYRKLDLQGTAELIQFAIKYNL